MGENRIRRWETRPQASRRFMWVSAIVFFVLAQIGTAQGVRKADATAFGRSVSLSDDWMAAPGDDPRWAQPDFDDRGWKVLDPDKPLTQQGFLDSRSIWYRAHVRMRPESPPAAIYVENLGFNYTLYANGKVIGRQGEANPDKATVEPFPNGFAISPGLIRSTDESLVLAIHVTGGPMGFLDLPPVEKSTKLELVSPGLVPTLQSFRLTHDWIEGFAILGLNLVVAFCGVVIWWSLREQLEYLALTIWVLANVLTLLMEFMAHLRTASPFSRWALLLVLMDAVSSVAELEFMRLILKRRQSALWLGLEAIVALINLSDPFVVAGLLPLSFGLGEIFLRPLVTEFLVFVLLLRAALRGNPDASVLLLPVVLWSAADLYKFARVGIWFAFKVFVPNVTGFPFFHFFSYSVTFGTLADIFGLLALVMIILRRTVRLSRERAELAAEVSAAEELQLLLMSRASRPTPGYCVETEYRPAGQVGGDFFLVQPCEEDDSLVAIVGDVSGKGLQAAMRVSLILGVLQREVMGYPDRVLKTLNAALIDQGDFGFTTACCVRLESDGKFCFANAGHLDPYVNGEEVNSEGALPLGIDLEACYPLYWGHLHPGQSMVLLSDGVLEARSRKGELFGFERTRSIVGSDPAAIATAAQQFGQEDDITVLALALA